jgi:hypothetical protein
MVDSRKRDTKRTWWCTHRTYTAWQLSYIIVYGRCWRRDSGHTKRKHKKILGKVFFHLFLGQKCHDKARKKMCLVLLTIKINFFERSYHEAREKLPNKQRHRQWARCTISIVFQSDLDTARGRCTSAVHRHQQGRSWKFHLHLHVNVMKIYWPKRIHLKFHTNTHYMALYACFVALTSINLRRKKINHEIWRCE